MITKPLIKDLKRAVKDLEFAQNELEDFVYYTDSDTVRDISSEIHYSLKRLKEYLKEVEDVSK